VWDCGWSPREGGEDGTRRRKGRGERKENSEERRDEV